MDFRLLSDPVEFRAQTRGLLADEAKNNLMLGILSTVINDPGAYEACRTMVVSNGGDVVAGALITTPPENLIVAAAAPGPALDTLAEGVLDSDVVVPRASGVRPVVDYFVGSWERRTGVVGRLTMTQGVYALKSVIRPAVVPGRIRRAGTGDLDVVLAWAVAFAAEALPNDPRDDARLERVLRQRLRGDGDAGIWLWEVDGEAVAMSAHSGPTGSGIRINAVYTPPSNRSNGYATALVAAQSQELLDSGYQFCFLFTDLANPTSNRIYESIGYERVAEAAVFEFEAVRDRAAV
jgi:hypothetical protein